MKLTNLYKQTIQGRDLYSYAQSPFLYWCTRFAPESEKDQLSGYDKLIMAKGQQFEENNVKEKYPGIKPIFVETTEDVINELKSGPAVLWNIPIFDVGKKLLGKTDLLVRDDSKPSNFGKFHYVVKELKNAKKLRKPKYIMQAAFYNYILGELQGYTPKYFYIVGREGEERIEYQECKARLFESLEHIKQIIKERNMFNQCKNRRRRKCKMQNTR